MNELYIFTIEYHNATEWSWLTAEVIAGSADDAIEHLRRTELVDEYEKVTIQKHEKIKTPYTLSNKKW